MINLANRLRTLRTQKEVDTLTLAEELGISETTYRRYERNESAPDLNILQKIATKPSELKKPPFFKEAFGNTSKLFAFQSFFIFLSYRIPIQDIEKSFNIFWSLVLVV